MEAEQETEEAAADGDLGERVGKLETGQADMSGKIDQILGILGKDKDKAHDAAEQHTEARLDRPSNVADEIRQQLDERDRRAKEDADASDLATLKAQVAELSEKAPEPMPRRVEKLMGWR